MWRGLATTTSIFFVLSIFNYLSLIASHDIFFVPLCSAIVCSYTFFLGFIIQFLYWLCVNIFINNANWDVHRASLRCLSLIHKLSWRNNPERKYSCTIRRYNTRMRFGLCAKNWVTFQLILKKMISFYVAFFGG